MKRPGATPLDPPAGDPAGAGTNPLRLTNPLRR